MRILRRRRRRRVPAVLLALLGVLATVQCGSPEPPQQHGQDDRDQTEHGIGHAGSVPHLRVRVIGVLPHDASSFTQGLELAGGILYEGTGRRGESLVRAVRPRTGEVLTQDRLPARFFGEGITVVDDRVWQLTWKAGVAFVRERSSLDEVRRVAYEGQGWGLCHDGQRLVMSDGSATLTFRDPVTFRRLGSVTVRAGGDPVEELNELECAGGAVWANVWRTDTIVRIDPGSGRVTAAVDASGLLPASARDRAGVLNGVAAVPGTDDFLLTGKNWPHLYRVRFVPE